MKSLLVIAGAITALVFIFIAYILLQSPDDSGCFVRDSARILDEQIIGNNNYQLFLITTGLQDKVDFLSLYKNAVEFNSCGQSDTLALDSQAIDYGPEGEEYVQWAKEIIITGEKIKIVYSEVEVTSMIVTWMDQSP